MHPIANRTDLIVKHIDDEVLFYNLKTHKAICLNVTAAAVYEACDGTNDIDDLAEVTDLSENEISRTLRNLNKQGLLMDGFSAPTILSRRAAFTTLAKGAIGTAPVVMAISVPSAAIAMSCLADRETCSSGSECCSGFCSSSNGRAGNCATPDAS